MNGLLTYNGFTLEYFEFGQGEKILFAFHGFNRNAHDFEVFESSLGKHYKIVSFNIFFYGKSRSEEKPEKAFKMKDLEGLINTYLEKNNIDKFSVMGFSLGGRFALACIELFPEKIRSAYLFAPDGIKINKWYKVLSKVKIGWKLYEHLIEKPDLFFKLSLYLKNKGIVSERLYSFANYHMQSKAQRKKIYDVWMILRELFPDIKKVQKSINHYDITVHLFFGLHDAVIPPSIGKDFVKGLKNPKGLHLVHMGHNLISYQMNSYLNKVLQK